MKKFIFALIFTFLMVSLYAQNVSDFEIQGNDDETMTILNYKGMAKDIVIPEKIFNMPVTRLREGAFAGKGLTSVSIPPTVIFIGDGAFRENQLTAITIPEAVEYIGDSAFFNNQLTGVTIPQKAITIGSGAFRHNRLTSVVIPDSVIYIGNDAFNNNVLTSVPIGDGLVFIGANAFYNHRTTSIRIPDTVVYIGSQAFRPNVSNSLTNISIGKYVTLGNQDVFNNNGYFDKIYQNNDKRGGTYAYADGAWTYTP